MNTKRFIAICLPALVLGMVSCHKPILSEPPVYGNLRFTQDPIEEITLANQKNIGISSVCAPGDSVTVFMQTGYTGSYITCAKYKWRLYVSADSVLEHTVEVVAPHKLSIPPMWTFKAPNIIGEYEVTFKAEYDYSAQTESGQIYGESAMYRSDPDLRVSDKKVGQ